MALGSANQVAQTSLVDNTAKNSASAANGAPARGGAFTDALDAVLAKPAPGTQTAANDDGTGTSTQQSSLGKQKSKLKNGAADAAAIAQQQAVIQKLQATNTGIDMPALRAAMGNSTATQPVGAVTQPVMIGAQPGTAGSPGNTANRQPAFPGAPGTAAGKQPAVPANDKATQQKLTAALAQAATAPVLKTGTADGSAVPNQKIGNAAHAKAQNDAQANTIDTITALAAKIAATSAITNSSDTAPTAAQGVATAEVATQTAAVTPGVTKLESAAVTNATNTALHASPSQAKIEAQALPVQFDAKPGNTDDGKNGAQSETSKDDNKDAASTGSGRTAGTTAKQADIAQANLPDAQQPTPQDTSISAQPAATQQTAAAIPADVTAATGVSAPATPAHIATILQVAQPSANSALQQAPDLAALGVSIAAKSKDGEKQFDIKMDPAELGRVDVRISVDSDGKAQAHLTAEKPQTLQLLQNDRGTLERSLKDAGLDLSNNGLNFSLKGEQQSATPTFIARNRALSISTVQTVDAISSNSSSSIAPGDSRLDIRV
jgi:flagellar hook-length control protein FliK